MSCCLTLNRLSWQFRQHHPDWLPTFAPVLLGLMLLLVGFGVVEGWTLLRLFAPILLTFCTILPLPSVLIAPLVGLFPVLIGLLYGDELNEVRQSIELSSAAVFGILGGKFLRGIECDWRLNPYWLLSRRVTH
jgi:hypothetical protein